MNRIEINLNQSVKVKLTKKALDMKQKELDEFNKKFKEDIRMP